jgi:putative FmdB family regulatory protein
MPIYDVYCKNCNITKEVLLKVDEPIPNCSECGEVLTKVCNCHSFKLVYNPKTDICAWGNENYATTQRYRHISKNKVDE